MENLQFSGVAAVLLAVAGGMAFYEWTRIRAFRPILNGHNAVVLYWVSYLSLFVLGVAAALAAVIRWQTGHRGRQMIRAVFGIVVLIAGIGLFRVMLPKNGQVHLATAPVFNPLSRIQSSGLALIFSAFV
jgi:hypothetical protein